MLETKIFIKKKYLSMALKIGKKAPDFEVADQDGKIVSLAEYKGRKLVLYFYPRDNTPGCTAEACNLRDNYKTLKRKGYDVLGVSTDNEKAHRKFIEKQKLPFRLLADVDKVLHSKYGTWIEKSMYGRKYMGTARITYLIDANGYIEDIIDQVDTKNHTDQILKQDQADAKEASKRSLSQDSSTTIGKKKPAKKGDF